MGATNPMSLLPVYIDMFMHDACQVIVRAGRFVTTAASSAKGTSSDIKDRDFHCDVQATEGTSFAAPLVAGSAVLLRQWFMKGFYKSSPFVPSGVPNSEK